MSRPCKSTPMHFKTAVEVPSSTSLSTCSPPLLSTPSPLKLSQRCNLRHSASRHATPHLNETFIVILPGKDLWPRHNHVAPHLPSNTVFNIARGAPNAQYYRCHLSRPTVTYSYLPTTVGIQFLPDCPTARLPDIHNFRASNPRTEP